MLVLRLFRRDQPFVQLEARGFAAGTLSLGRDPSADWPFGETDESLSRVHCLLSLENGRLTLVDKSKNGTFLSDGARAPREVPVELKVRDSLSLGAFLLLVDQPALTGAADHSATVVSPPLTPVDWPDAAPSPPARREATLLQAFCDGAKLDASAFSGEDPFDVMARAGAIYQQAVLGLSTLMAARAAAKDDYNLERTTISGADNNPFKWAPSRKLAEDLLKARDDGFLTDSHAVRASFDDLIRHLHAVVEGADAAADYAVQALAPDAIQAEARAQGTLLRGQAAVCWDIYKRRHAALAARTPELASPLARAFGAAYGGAINGAAE
ncbi:MAG: type VI secretion system-associated FHA domain protein [Caulobacteraceae bacterium]